MQSRNWVFLALLVFPMLGGANDFSGRFHAATEDGVAALDLEQTSSNRYQGTLSMDGEPAQVVGMVSGEQLVGELREGDGEAYPFKARLFGGQLQLIFGDGEYLTLTRGVPSASAPSEGMQQGYYPYSGGGRSYQPGPSSYPGQPQASLESPYTQPVPALSINGQALSAEQARQLAGYGIQAQSGSYWYDPVCGAWGLWGGPTAGFVQAGIPVPAPLPAQASNGNTGVFVNGRNIAISELSYLQQLAQVPIAPGQYWLDAQGNAGPVGGGAVINYLERARTMGGGGAWYGKGASGWEAADGSGGVWIANPYGGTGTSVTY